MHVVSKRTCKPIAKVRQAGVAKRPAEAADVINRPVKKRYILIGLLASSMAAFGQRSNTTPYTKKKLRQTDVQILFSYYTQDNNHSAVTGGTGTEDLQVYAPQLSIDTGNDSTTVYHVDAGIDIITSASTDNIDFVRSSASRMDARTHVNVGFNHRIRNTGTTYGVNGGLSIESDYFSRAIGASVSHATSPSREFSASFQMFFDDLRWGRLDNGKAQKLLYPVELRNKEWFTMHNRNSFNLALGWYETINTRMAIGFYPGITYQTGLLSTPFHRVYFTDKSLRVENLPDQRLKFPVGIQLNTFLGSRYILRSNYRFYWDNYGIASHSINMELAVKMSYALSLTPFVRLYEQTQANYFKPYSEHDVMQEFYTSDYDLSKFTSYKTGLGLRYTPLSSRWRELEIRYAYYKRSDGLEAHMITTYIDLKYEKRK